MFSRIFPVGTRSVLFGYHCFLLHGWIVALAWIRLFGFPWHPAIWASFFLHDIGYLGKPNVDGPEGETHPELGAKIVHWLFDWKKVRKDNVLNYQRDEISLTMANLTTQTLGWKIDKITSTKTKWKFYCHRMVRSEYWKEFCLFHSRYYSKAAGKPYSKLCIADKYAIVITPWWIHLGLSWLSGELKEYLETARQANAPDNRYHHTQGYYNDCKNFTPRTWHSAMTGYLKSWVEEAVR